MTAGTGQGGQPGRLRLKINGHERAFHFRPDSVGDQGVIRQIFRNAAYEVGRWRQGKALLRYYRAALARGERALIIDAGANIGAGTVYFACAYEAALVYAIEPEANNLTLLRRNCAGLDNVRVFEGAIGGADGEARLRVAGLADWAFRLADDGEVAVPVIAPDTILGQPGGAGWSPFIFKVDIEGGEADLFSGSPAWVDRFPLIVIELHDWMLPFQGSSRAFIQAMAAYDFDLVPRGENLFCFNRRLLAPLSAD